MANEVRLIDLNRTYYELERFYNGYTGELRRVASEALDLVCMMPEVDPESLRPKGRWMDQEWNDMWQSMTATCSHCLERGEVRVRTNEHGMKVINSPSCPNCGADMREGNE